MMRKSHNPMRWAVASLAAVGIALTAVPLGCGPDADQALEPKQYVYFPPPPTQSRVQFLRHLSGAQDFADSKSGLQEFLVGKETELYKTIAKPFGIAIRDGKIFVTDTKMPRVAVLNMRDRSFGQFGTKGRGQLRKPINVRIDRGGRFYVTDTIRNQVVVFDPEGKYLREYGDGKEFRPSDVIVTDDELFVLDGSADVVKVYDLNTGRHKRTFGGVGGGFGQFRGPTNMVQDEQGYIYVCDSMNFRVQKLDKNGKHYFQFGQAGDTPGRFARPKGLAVDRAGIIYVLDSRLQVVQLFDQKGNPLMHFGGSGVGPGQLLLPAQVTLDYDNIELFREDISPDFKAEYLILVTYQIGPNKVSVYAFGRGPAPTSQPAPATRPAPAAQPK
ncbi:hypothetical protein LCGC14_2222460 [marine sediment metagenome]|uniref:SMP-30/Gluconolactonase/LRE-like region domain-containing protein n=1 Tax=marine sediment metagenome TaxID=412755 RepID=A0A0F9G626_9ZZZZ